MLNSVIPHHIPGPVLETYIILANSIGFTCPMRPTWLDFVEMHGNPRFEQVFTVKQSCNCNLVEFYILEYRNGDIRHCYADITKAKKLLDFDPKVKLEKGLSELDSWVEDNKSTARDLFESSLQELKSRNLT